MSIPSMPKRRFNAEKLEARIAPTITTTTTCVKQPGPTDTLVTTATNPGNNSVPGHQSTTVVKNNQC